MNFARREGIKEGEIKGEIKGRIEVARSLKQLGIPVSQIVLSTGLTKDQINQL
jgi:predicted transposase/invertase (TIGR01784 family)